MSKKSCFLVGVWKQRRGAEVKVPVGAQNASSVVSLARFGRRTCRYARFRLQPLRTSTTTFALHLPSRRQVQSPSACRRPLAVILHGEISTSCLLGVRQATTLTWTRWSSPISRAEVVRFHHLYAPADIAVAVLSSSVMAYPRRRAFARPSEKDPGDACPSFDRIVTRVSSQLTSRR
jgi:hypothetical protein